MNKFTVETVKNLIPCKECYVVEPERCVSSICASDLMSEVLIIAQKDGIIVTNLLNIQTIRTAEMVEASAIVFVRGKKPTKEMVELAKKSGISIYVTDKGMFETCGMLYEKGLSMLI
ncbi:MAG: hypothetical protein QME48_05800 [bacterium]|uniref:DRTGG domain protein n=2 Tax=Bacteria candidate phyla TaxID=1783234 RepID=A0A101I0H5_UNCT6|nr:MAG: DRTGG domain protein [candidate division TA06 bacterium 32_111]KUK86536.1 MAG: DRTGG domain protein [candidate division TA06 bacterium 34_109]MDI6700730.1 hypothetical protein [bacterium]HAF07885.1 hypothetical protein [candidate division WOR-3 bacterium]HCP16413.1 hypothetical protein [candidate division WOR-3 bacterium]